MILLLSACATAPEFVAMSGAVSDAPYDEGSPVGGAALEVTALVDEALTVIDDQTGGDDGTFAVSVPAGEAFFLEVSADGFVPTAFSGVAGIQDFAAPEGYPWMVSVAGLDTLRADFAACPTVAAEGAVVAGEVRVNTAETAYASMPLVSTGTVRVFDGDSNEYAACYLDDAGDSSADATETGATGRFAVFGVPTGGIVVDVRYTDPGGTVPVELYQFLAPEGGVVPLYPALVEALY
jgi:hypothetical protein